MPSYTTLKSGSKNNGSNETLNVFLYPNTSSDEGQCENSLANALDHLGQQALDNSSASEYYVKISYEYPNLSTSDKNTFWNKWRSYSNNRGNYDGIHVAVCSTNFGGRAESPTYSGAWNWSMDGVCGFGNPKEHYKNLIIQEVLHPYINQSLNAVSSMINDEEHDLGTVLPGWAGDGPTTPMCTSYVDSHGRHGDPDGSKGCDSTAPWNLTYTTQLTSCTKDAMKATSDSA